MAPRLQFDRSDTVLRNDTDADARVLWTALTEVMDPEVPVSLVDLGLIYDVRRTGALVEVDLSFTATACPAMGFIQEDIRERLLREPGVAEVTIQIVWEPVWTPERITDIGREQLKSFGISL